MDGETLQISMTQGDEELAAWRAKVTVAYIMVKRWLPKKQLEDGNVVFCSGTKCEESFHHTKNIMGKS